MKLIAIASEDDRGLKGTVSAHFGRCPHYTLVEVEDAQVVSHRVVNNPNAEQHRPGAMPKFIRSLGADAILAGGMGPRAVDIFQRYGIEVVTGAAGRVDTVLEAYLAGSMTGIVPCNHDHPNSCGGHEAGERRHDEHEAASEGAAGASGRVAVPAVDDSGLGAIMDPRFGRAPFFALLDIKSGKLLGVVSNAAAAEAHGAGTRAAQLMREQDVRAVVAGRFGPKASQALQGMGIELFTAPEGLTVSQATGKLSAGTLPRTA